MDQPSVSDFLAGLAADPDATATFDADRGAYLTQAGFTDPGIISAFTAYDPNAVRSYVNQELGKDTDTFWTDNDCNPLVIDRGGQ